MNYSMETYLLLILLLNTVITLVYMIVMWIRTKMSYVFLRGAIMILCPVTAPFCYFSSYLQNLFFSQQDVDYANLSMDKTKKEFEQPVDRETEMKILPIEEVLTVSTTKDRREAVINLLKTDVQDRLPLLRKAIENEDSETAHYAASALTDILGSFAAQVNQFQAVYDTDRENQEVNEQYIDLVQKILESGALFGTERMMYEYIYTGLVENLMKYHPGALTIEHNTTMVRALLGEGKGKEAEAWAKESIEKWPDDERSYLSMMYVEYHLGKQEDFYDCLGNLAKSGIALSREGLDIMRFWLKK